MAGRFPLYADADVHGPLIFALRGRGWDLVRAMDLYPHGTADAVHFERAARENRVLISNDQDMEGIANHWLAVGRPFRGLILWPQEHYKRMGYAELVARIEALSEATPTYRDLTTRCTCRAALASWTSLAGERGVLG